MNPSQHSNNAGRLALPWLKCAAVLLLSLTMGTAIAGKGFRYFVTGDANATVTAPTSLPQPSFVLMGGGPDIDQAFRWMITRAGIKPGTGGRFVVIRATGTDAYNPYFYYSNDALSTTAAPSDGWVGGAAMGLSSAETLIINSRSEANSKVVADIVSKANAVWIAGGDQSDYIRFWKGTRLDRTLQGLMARNVPIGGTSAGLAVLGQFDFSAMKDTVYSSEALADPYNKFMTLDPDPLSLTGGFLAPPAFSSIIFDSHVDTRDRMGRLVTFVSRLVAPSGSTGCPGGILPASATLDNAARGIGIGAETALLVERNSSNGHYTGKRVTNPTTTTVSAVYFVRPATAPSVCAAKTPLSVFAVDVMRLVDSSASFDLTTWSGAPHHATIDAFGGALSPVFAY